MSKENELSRRERQIMDILHARGEALAREVQEQLPDPPSYSATRALLRILEDKGHIKHREDGGRYVYMPKGSRETASRSALARVVDTFFGGSARLAMAALIERADTELSEAELRKLETIVNKGRKEGR
jgi:BlaI family penicillinase repressor